MDKRKENIDMENIDAIIRSFEKNEEEFEEKTEKEITEENDEETEEQSDESSCADKDTESKEYLKKYLKDISRFDPLDKETLHHYGEIILNSKMEKEENGRIVSRIDLSDPIAKEAVDILVNHHAKYVVSRALELKNPDYNDISIMTLIEEGNIALFEAIQNWDYREGSLTNFSRKHIDGRIIKLFPKSAPLPGSFEEQEELAKLTDVQERKKKEREWKKENFRRLTEEYAVFLNDPLDSDNANESETFDSIIADARQTGVPSDPFSYHEFYEKLRAIKLTDPFLKAIHKETLLGTKENKILKKYHLKKEDLKNYQRKIIEVTLEQFPYIELNELTDKEMADIYRNLQDISSGETVMLEKKQYHYEKLFQHSEAGRSPKQFPAWTFHKRTFWLSKQKKYLYEEFRHIKSVPCYKYVILYLLDEYYIHIGDANEEKLWNYLETNWRLQKKTDAILSDKSDLSMITFTDSHCAALMSLLYNLVNEDYAAHSLTLSTTDFKKLIYFENGNTEEFLNHFALVFHMNEETYYVFREKVARIRRKDFLNQNFVLTLLVLKYADQCDIEDWVSAFYKLKQLYPLDTEATYEKLPSDVTNTIALGNEILINLEEKGVLKEEYKNDFFVKPLDTLQDFFRQELLLKNSEALRTFEEEFKFQWEKLKKILSLEEQSAINRSEQEYKKTNNTSDFVIDCHKVQKFLYGNDVIKMKLNPSKLKKNNVSSEDSFLETQEFNNTFIDDNILVQFGNVGNIRRRNILLTILFLNFSYDLNSPNLQNLSYRQKVSLFQNRVVEPFVRCGFLPFHPSIGYDAFIKLLLTCSNPLDLFRYIWRDKLKGVLRNE